MYHAECWKIEKPEFKKINSFKCSVSHGIKISWKERVKQEVLQRIEKQMETVNTNKR